MSRDVVRRIAVVLVVVLVASSTMVVGVSAAQTSDDDEPVEAADEIYVEEDGDAVLVYRNSSDGSDVEYGVDVGSNVFYALVESPVESDTGVRTDLTSVITDDRFATNGSLTAPRPDEIDDLSVDVSGESTSQNAQFDATASVTINNTEVPSAALVRSASTSGNLTTTATEFRTAGEFQTTLATEVAEEQHRSFTLTESDGDYTLTAAQDYIVSDFEVDNYDTRSDAKATLEAQFGSTAEQFGGDATVTIQSYSFDSASNRLDIEYEVQYTGIEEGVADTIAAQLAASEDVNLSDSEIDQISTRIQRLNIDEISTRFDLAGTESSGSFRIELQNYDEVVRAGLTVAEATDTESMSTEIDFDRVRARLDAQAAADLKQRYEWSASVDQPDTERTIVSADAQYRTTNWNGYRDELENRGVTTVDTEYELLASAEGDEIAAEGSLELTGQDLLDRAASGVINGTETEPETAQFIEAFRNADLEKAKFDVSVDGSTARFEAGAKFDNLSAVRDAFAETSDAPRFTSIVGRTEGDTTESYVFVEDAVEPGATESDVRGLSYVDSETQVNLPNEWDRTFPSVDTQRAADFLGVSLDDGDDGDDGDETDGATVELRPANSRVATGGTTTYKVVVSDIDGGVGGYGVVVNSSDTSQARITSAAGQVGSSQNSTASDGSGARIGAFGGDTSDTGPVTIATVTVKGETTGDADITLSVNDLSDESGTEYAVASSSGANLTVVDEIVAPDVTGDGNRATDPDNDGQYEDLNGDGDATAGDATVLFNAVFERNPAVMDNPDLFDFSRDGSVTAGDATVLFDEVFG